MDASTYIDDRNFIIEVAQMYTSYGPFHEHQQQKPVEQLCVSVFFSFSRFVLYECCGYYYVSCVFILFPIHFALKTSCTVQF